MLPRWYQEWNAKNPVDYIKPIVVFGVLGGVVFTLIALVSLGQPYKTSSFQTGVRGIGMSVTKFNSDIATPDPDIENVFEDEPWIPEGGEPLAKDIYENVQVLGDLTEDNFNRLMSAMTEWVSPDEGCAYCHGDVDVEEYGADDLYTKVVARSMLQMTQNINENWGDHVNANKEVGVTCFTCHRGQNVPSEIWYKQGDVNDRMAGWSANQNRVTSVSNSTSLPSDYLEEFLLNYESINVHDFESRATGIPGQDGYSGIQHAERTYAFMNYIDNSLGVNCVFCHNTRAFYDSEQVTPQWSTAQLGIGMVQELNEEYILPLEETLPEHRLGAMGDAPKLACKTCHKGYQQPLQGTNVIGDWPELATSGPPEYASE